MTKVSSKLNFCCRVCSSDNIERFTLNHYGFPGKNPNNWISFFCFDCGSVSDFTKQNEIDYADGTFRNRDYHDLESNQKEVLPPIDPWSVLIFRRWEHIYKSLKNSTNIFSNTEIKMLDFGSYNGFLPYALSQKHKIKSYVEDLDPNGLKMAKFLGSNTINIGESEINEKNFDLITIVHVLEHLDKPIDQVKKLKNLLSDEGVLYAEVPNLYGFPLQTSTHKIAFTEQSIIKMFKSAGFEILDFGSNSSPKEILKLGHVYSHDKENLYIVCCKKEKNLSLKFPNNEIPKSIQDFKLELKLTYAKLMLKKISYTLLRPSLGHIKRGIIFIIYGVIDILTLKLFKISLISKLFKQK